MTQGPLARARFASHRTSMLPRHRLVVIAALASAAACTDPVPLPTTLDHTATQADVAAARAGFAAAAVVSFRQLSDEVDATMREQPRLATYGKTYTWSTDSAKYTASTRTGAPGNGSRFVLYATTAGGVPSLPLTERGHVEISGAGGTATAKVVTTTGVVQLDYELSSTGTEAAPAFSASGDVGSGSSLTQFTLVTSTNGVGSFVQTWRSTTPSRALASVVTRSVGTSSTTVNASSRAGVRKIEVGGSLSTTGSGTLIVKVGNELFGRIVRSGGTPGTEAYTNPLGVPLAAADASALSATYAWFSDSYVVLDVLIGPLRALLDLAPAA